MLRATLAIVAIIGLSAPALAQKINVKAATPNQGAQATVDLDVVIDGSGFGPGAKARFVLSGTDNPDGILVKNTRFVSSTQVVATIDIAETASLASFDIKVTLSGRTGKGTDLFQVVQKGNPNACVPLPLDASRFTLVRTLNIAVGSQPLYGPAFGVALAARPATLTYATGTRDLVVLAAGTNGGRRIEIFFVDPATGALLDGMPLVAGGPVQPHISIDTTPLGSDFGPTQLAAGDVNRDGLPDVLASTTRGSGQVVGLAVAERDGDGVVTYALRAVPPPAERAGFGMGIALGDLDGDGRDEIVVSKGRGGKGQQQEYPKLLVYSAPSVVPTLIQTVATPGVQTGTDFAYATHLAVADVSGDGFADVIASAQKWPVDGLAGAGAVFVHLGTGVATSPLHPTPRILTSAAPAAGDEFGAHVAAGRLTGLPDGQVDLLAIDYWTAPATGAEVFPGPVVSSGQTSLPALQFTATPGYATGWATRGASIADLNGDGLSDVVVGTPNTPDGACNSVGTAYVFFADGTTATGTTGWATFRIEPPVLDRDFGGFGWSTATVAGSPLIFIGENGRDVGSVSSAGQVYIYRVIP
jgi:hypothetical protein